MHGPKPTIGRDRKRQKHFDQLLGNWNGAIDQPSPFESKKDQALLFCIDLMRGHTERFADPATAIGENISESAERRRE